MILIVVALSFILLMLAFRSLLVPLTAAPMNLLSIASRLRRADGGLREGMGRRAHRPQPPDPIVSFVPLLMFAILFGLSMDYQVFLLPRISELYAKTGTTTTR